ncbi:uncharacterized protein LOC126892791 [Diabrotica virgifera virgifera]|uniref:Uncharacterized protein n=1 Tax=Diabrotica virgifera virgifera TaxID=50390 RepID=A0ABM5L7R2_DIAVI|nr:uncharacterized protein LOC126892791 [Diabrotica virgifera virgifera]XP_050518476.1 uncharacterized protein LOC126892791 [Diabrotica virgifera virgifera]
MADTSNIADIEDDPFAEVNMTVYYEQMKQTWDILNYTSYFTDTIKIILSILSIAADICIITIIIKNPKLKTKTNIYILHHSIWHIVSVTVFSLFFALSDLVEWFNTFPMVVYSTFWKMHVASVTLVFLFGLCLAFDWFLNIHSPHFVKFSALFNKYAIYLIYIVAALFDTIEYFVHMFILSGLYIFVVLSLSLFNFLDYRSNKKEVNLKNYGLASANIIIYFWFPFFLYDQLLEWSYGSFTWHTIVLYTMFLSEWFSLSVSLALIITLIRMDIDIKVAMLKIFNRRSRRYQDVVETLEEAENEDVAITIATDSKGV